MQEKIAIDVVLLLPEDIQNLCKELNKTSDRVNYISFEDGYNPHVTLGMGSILVENVEPFKKELAVIVENAQTPVIKLSGMGAGKYTHFAVEVDTVLQNLHNSIFDLITKYSAGTVDTENFFEMPAPSSLIDWVNNFKSNNAYENYHAHITLGVDITTPPPEFPIFFKPAAVGFFHLGVHGTCKKLLGKFELK